jgi:CBS domain-containing protein
LITQERDGELMRLDEVPWACAVTGTPETHIEAAVRLMDSRGCDGIVLLDEGGIMVGCFTRDHLESPLLPHRDSWGQLPVGPYASPCTFYVAPETSVQEALHLMRTRGLYALPVRRNGKLAGMVTRRDLEARIKGAVAT